MGETPNIAARIQGQAAPDEVVISAATYRLVEGLFDVKIAGNQNSKAIATPLTLYRVIKEGEAQSRFEVVVRKGLTPCGARTRIWAITRTLGAGERRGRTGRVAQRRARHWQITLSGSAQRPSSRGRTLSGVALFALCAEQCVAPDH